MKLGLMLGYSGAEMKLPVELVQHAEALGFDSVWTAEAYGSDATSPLAYLAAVTYQWPPSYVWGGFVVGLSVSAILLTWRYVLVSRVQFVEGQESVASPSGG